MGSVTLFNEEGISKLLRLKYSKWNMAEVWLTSYNHDVEGVPIKLMETQEGANLVHDYLSFSVFSS